MAIDFSLSELVALAVESFFYGTLNLPSLPPPPLPTCGPVLKKKTPYVAGIYFALFCTSFKVLLNKRKAISGATTLLSLAGVFGVLISWVSSARSMTTSRVLLADLGGVQHILTDGIRIVYAFKRDNVADGADLYYGNVASALSLIKTSLYLITTVLFDAFIVSTPRAP